MQVRCPPIGPELIVYLETVFPDITVNPDEVNPHRAFGRAEVIRHLKAVMQTQEEAPDVQFQT